MPVKTHTLLTLGALAGAFALLAAPAASAATPSAGWSISSVAQPTNFSSSDTQDTVEELVVSATGGTYELKPSHSAVATGPIEWDASAQEVREALETLSEVGDGNVSVTGGPGDATGSNPYTVTWVGALSAGSPGNVNVTENHLTNGAGEGTAAHKRIQEGKAEDRYTLIAVNTGSRPAEGEVTITDMLPHELVPVEMEEVEEPASGEKWPCSLTEVKCTYKGKPVPPGHELRVRLHVAVASAAVKGSLVNLASVSGGGGGEAKTSETTPVNMGPAPFGIDQLGLAATDPEGALDTQAGDHPYAVTTSIQLNTARGTQHEYEPVREVKDVAVELPLGFVGDPLAAERCPEIDFTQEIVACPPGSRVGTVRFTREGGTETGGISEHGLYNVVPARGFPAELGFASGFHEPILVYASVVPSPEGYRLRFATPGALSGTEFESIALTVFGSPGEHDGTGAGAAFITNPSACSGEPLTVRAEVTAWEGGSDVKEETAYPSITGCNLLTGPASFSPSLEVQPETTQADTPSGYEVDLKVPQAPNLFGALATPDLKNATVTLPAGVSVSPSAASGPDALEGCTEAQIDLLGTELGEGHPGGNGSPYDDGLTHASPGHCPEGSRIGEVEVKTPVLEEALRGHVYLAEPHCGQAGQAPCTEAEAEAGKVFGLYLEMAGSGVIIKLAGSVEVGGYGGHNDLAPGQLRARFDENPQFPFEDLKMIFSGGQRAALGQPADVRHGDDDQRPGTVERAGIGSERHARVAVHGDGLWRRIRPCFQRGDGHADGGCVQPVHADVQPSRRRTGSLGADGDDAAGPVGRAEGRGTVSRTPGVSGRVRSGEPDRARPGRGGRGLRAVVGDRPGVPHRAVQGRAVRAVHRHPGGRGPVQPRKRGRPRDDRHQPEHRADHDHERPVSAERGRRPAADQNGQRDDRPVRVHVQPDELRSAERSRARSRAPRAQASACPPRSRRRGARTCRSRRS